MLMDGAGLKRKEGDHKKVGKSSLQSKKHNVPLKENHETESALIAATLANRQLQVSKSLSTYYTTENERLETEREQLENDKAKTERDTVTVFEALEKQVELLKCEKTRLQHDVENALHSAQQKAEEVTKLETALKERDLLVIDLQQRVGKLGQELNDVKTFRELRDEYKCEMEAMQKSHTDEKKEIAEARALRLRLMEERIKLQVDKQALKQGHTSDVRKAAMELLPEKTRNIDKLNQKLMGERSLLLADVKGAREEIEALRPVNNSLRRDVVLAKSAEAEYNARGARQVREVSRLKLQVKTAEDNLNAVVAEYEKRLRKQAKDHVAVLSKVTGERDEAMRVAESLRKELVKLRSISKQLVERRSELESFFHQALAEVRMAMLQERCERPQAIECRQGDEKTPRANARLKGPGKLLMISDRGARKSMRPTTSSSASCGDDKSHDPSFLPLISPRRGNSVPTNDCCLSSAKERHKSRFGAVSNRSIFVEGEPTLGGGKLSQIPGVPKLRDLQSVEISQLSWQDKERVLQAIFKQLQKGGSHAKESRRSTSTDDTEFFLNAAPVDPTTKVFLT